MKTVRDSGLLRETLGFGLRTWTLGESTGFICLGPESRTVGIVVPLLCRTLRIRGPHRIHRSKVWRTEIIGRSKGGGCRSATGAGTVENGWISAERLNFEELPSGRLRALLNPRGATSGQSACCLLIPADAASLRFLAYRACSVVQRAAAAGPAPYSAPAG